MTLGDLWPLLRSASRKLAVLGWASTAAGMAAGLAVAVASGTSLSPVMISLQLLSFAGLGLAMLSFTAAVLLKPKPDQRLRFRAAPAGRAAAAGKEALAYDAGAEFPSTLSSLLPATLVLLLGAATFGAAGLVLRGGPSPQSVAFCTVFALAASASGFTYLLFSRVAPPDHPRPRSPRPPGSP